MKHRIAETEMHSRGVPEVQPLTWNDTDGVPSSYNDLYYYKDRKSTRLNSSHT